jgi:RNA polymerase sigma-70 factor (ECF subfamily)
VSAPAEPRLTFVCEDGDPFEVEDLYRRHGGWLVAFLRRRFGRETAEDLAQEVFVRTVGARTQIRNPRAFLARVAVTAALDQKRRRAARPTLVAESARSPGAEADQAEALLLKQVILSLPPRLQLVFLLSRFGGLTYEEIARRLGISPKTVEKRMSKALAICAARLRG